MSEQDKAMFRGVIITTVIFIAASLVWKYAASEPEAESAGVTATAGSGTDLVSIADTPCETYLTAVVEDPSGIRNVARYTVVPNGGINLTETRIVSLMAVMSCPPLIEPCPIGEICK